MQKLHVSNVVAKEIVPLGNGYRNKINWHEDDPPGKGQPQMEKPPVADCGNFSGKMVCVLAYGYNKKRDQR